MNSLRISNWLWRGGRQKRGKRKKAEEQKREQEKQKTQKHSNKIIKVKKAKFSNATEI